MCAGHFYVLFGIGMFGFVLPKDCVGGFIAFVLCELYRNEILNDLLEICWLGVKKVCCVRFIFAVIHKTYPVESFGWSLIISKVVLLSSCLMFFRIGAGYNETL